VNALPFLDPQAPIGRRAAFMYKHFWATQYKRDELYPCGWYPNQHAGGDGLPKWVEANRSLENENVVVWYTMNYHHLSRTEDWPVQPVVYAGFHWMPDGFFDENPAMDVPPPEKNQSSCCS
jgi:primary-amine oxidase